MNSKSRREISSNNTTCNCLTLLKFSTSEQDYCTLERSNSYSA